MNFPCLIASYPRSGSTWLRFILCNLLYPEIEHTFDTVNRHIPQIDDPAGMKAAIAQPSYYKTHGLRHGGNILWLYRHVGDVLISEWWYKRKFHGELRDLHSYLEDDDYGRGWRENVDFYFPSVYLLSFEDLSDSGSIYVEAVPDATYIEALERAMKKSSFAHLQEVEKKGFGNYPAGDPAIPFFRSGQSGQWRDLHPAVQSKLLEKNYSQLKALGYLE